MISLVFCLVAEIVTFFLKMSDVSVRASIKTRFLNADLQNWPAQLDDRRNTITWHDEVNLNKLLETRYSNLAMIIQILFCCMLHAACCMPETVTYFRMVSEIGVWVQVKAKISNVGFKCKQGSFSLLSFYFSFWHSSYLSCPVMDKWR